jgi:hypothetical protein
MVTLVGTTSGTTFVGFPLPQEGRRMQAKTSRTRETTERYFPIKSFAKESGVGVGKHSV